MTPGPGPERVLEDSVPADTILVPIPPEEIGDTLPLAVAVAGASVAEAPPIPRFTSPETSGWSFARWTWNRDELSRMPGMTLFDLIERVPGFAAFRAGEFGRPAGLTSLGMGGGRIRIRWDGYELDPHAAASFPIEAIPVVDLGYVTVERGLSEILIDIEPYRLDQPEPYSFIHIGTGVFDTRLLRGLVSRGVGSRSIATAGLDLTTTRGIGIDEEYGVNTVFGRWSYAFSPGGGVEFEARRSAIDRDGEIFPIAVNRTDLIVRARQAFGTNVIVDGFAGRSDAVDEIDGSDSDDEILGTVQAGVRAAYSTATFSAWVSGSGRTDLGPGLTGAPFESRNGVLFRPRPDLILQATADLQSADGVSTRFGAATAYSPVPMISVFAEAEFGEWAHPRRLLPDLPVDPEEPEDPEEPDTEAEPVRPEVQFAAADASGLRAGIEVTHRLGAAGAAVIRSGTSPVAGFGLPFDIDQPLRDAEPLTGLEVYFDVPVIPGRDAFRINGWYTRWIDDVTRPYTPSEIGRVGLMFHGLYINGQLEPFMRLEYVRQGAAAVPDPVDEGSLAVMPVTYALNFDLRLRILDVQAFLTWENILTAQRAIPLPDLPTPQPRIIYGASWRFRN